MPGTPLVPLINEIFQSALCRLCPVQNVVMLMSDFVDWLIPDIPKDISLQIHKEKILMVELFMKEEQGKRLAAQDKYNQDNCTSPSPANKSPSQPRSRPVTYDNWYWTASCLELRDEVHPAHEL